MSRAKERRLSANHSRAVARVVSPNHSRARAWRISANHSRAMDRRITANHSRAVALIADKYHFDLASLHILALQSIGNIASAVTGARRMPLRKWPPPTSRPSHSPISGPLSGVAGRRLATASTSSSSATAGTPPEYRRQRSAPALSQWATSGKKPSAKATLI